jgi:hypothetical protein
MATLFFTKTIGNDRTLYLAPLTERRIAMSGQEIDDPSGYFLFEQRGSDAVAGIEIIAQAVDEAAAMRLVQMFDMT